MSSSVPVGRSVRRRSWMVATVVVAVVAVLLPTSSLPAQAETTFSDVSESHPFAVEIGWLVDEGVTTGFPDGTFRPGQPVTRQAFAAFLERYEGPAGFVPPATASFSDVPTDHPFFDEIEWLASTGITTGFPDGTFRPAATITRQAIAAFFARYNGTPGWVEPATATFNDVATDHPFFSEIEWLASTDITTGFPEGGFRPGADVTRQATAAFFFRYDEKFAAVAAPGAPTDVVAVAGDGQATVSWVAPTSDGGAPIVGYRVTTSPGDETTEVAAPGTELVVTGLTNGQAYTFTVAAENAVGYGPESAPSDPVTPQGDISEVPPDPATVAPEIDGTVEPDVYSLTRFLWAGSPRIQTGVGPDTIERELAAAVRGRVIDVDGDPIVGARVTVLGHGEYGATRSRDDGGFDLVVNADRHHVVVVQSDDHPMVQRPAAVTRNQWTHVDDIVLTPYDTKATVVETGADDVQVHRATTSDDVDGERTATLVVPPGTEADLVLPDGSRVALDDMTVRATEYTVGDRGLDAMPGELPPNVGYTYAVEFSVDEALDAGAAKVEFDEPIVSYTDNFVGFPVGVVVPAAYYDQTLGRWVAENDGRVIGVVSESAGLALLDVDGDGEADSGALLAELGITPDEQATIADLYEPGDSLWRVLVPHFSPWDYNWPDQCSPGPCGAPPSPDGETDRPTEDKCTKDGSIVACQDQVLGERIGVVGTGYELNYWSDRAQARSAGRDIDVRLTTADPPSNLLFVDFTVNVGGQQHRERFDVQPDLFTSFSWDGLDAYGRPYPASTFAQIQIDYVYRATLAASFSDSAFPSSFGSPALGLAGAFRRDANEFEVGRLFSIRLDNRDASALGVGGWTFDAHHRLDVSAGQLIEGDGTTREIGDVADFYSMEPVTAGLGDAYVECITPSCGDGGPAIDAEAVMFSMAVSPDGRLHFHDLNTNTIRRIEADGTIDSVFGTGEVCTENPATGCGTGGPATDMAFGGSVESMSFGPDGTLYVLDAQTAGGGGEGEGEGGEQDGGGGGEGGGSETAVIRAITPDGQVQHIGGTGKAPCNLSGKPGCGDGGPATEAGWSGTVGSLTVTPNGDLYLIDGPRIRRIAGGRIDHAFGCVSSGCEDEVAGESNEATFMSMIPSSITAAPDGSLMLFDGGDPKDNLAANKIRRIDPAQGTAVPLAGTSHQYLCRYTWECRDNWPAIDAEFSGPAGMVVDPDGYIHKFETWRFSAGVDRRFYPGGTIYRVAGDTSDELAETCTASYQPGDCGDGGPAIMARFSFVFALAAGPDGSIWFHDFRSSAIRRIAPRDEIVIPSTDGGRAFLFDDEGRHLSTRDAATGVVIHSFGYDADGRLASITDRNGNVTTIQRDAAGAPLSITSPWGQVTTLTTHPDGWLASVANPAGDTHTMTYGASGLLATHTDPVGNESRFTFDADGYLIRDENDAGGSLTLERTPFRLANERGFDVVVTTEQGRTTTYEVRNATNSPFATRRVIDPAGGITTITVDGREDNERTVLTYPDGRRVEVTFAEDPRWGRAARVLDTLTETVPGLPPSTVQFDRHVEFDPADRFRATSVVDTTVHNGRTSTFTWDAATGTETWTDPNGDVAVRRVDARGRVIEVIADPALATEAITYSDEGLVTSVANGSRVTTYTYDTFGRQATVTNPEGHTTTYEYDAAGRNTVIETPEGDRWGTAYDANGQAISFTSPEGQVHDVGYNARGNLTELTGPDDVTETRAYTPDQEMVLETLGDGRTVARTFDAAGRVSGSIHEDASTTYGFLGVTTRLGTLVWDQPVGPDQTMTATYRGPWVSSIAFTGASVGRVDIGYDANRWVSSLAVNGVGGYSFPITRDADGNMATYGPFTLDRSGPDRLTTAIADGVGGTAITYDGFGDVASRAVTVAATPAHSIAVVRDAMGRIVERTETTPQGTSVVTYGYDPTGRLVSYAVDGAPATVYAYDGNGNPVTGPSGAATFVDDRVVEAGEVTYTYDAAGFLTARGDTTFDYSPDGELLRATVEGAEVTYTYDGFGRRTTRTDADGTSSYLYGNPSNPFQVTAARLPDSSLDWYFYDDVGALFAMRRAGVVYHIGIDQLGSPVSVVDATGEVVKHVVYDPWGNVVDDSAPDFAMVLGYAGGLVDDDTGLVRFGYRDYDPTSGRWTASDPALFSGGRNLYAYVDGNPANLVDPTGLMAFCFGGSFYAGVGGGGEICIDREGASICAEAGVGVGGGTSAGFGSVSDPQFTEGVEGTFQCLGNGITAGGEVGIDECGFIGDFCAGGSAGFGFASGKACVNGAPQTNFGAPPSPEDIKPGCKAEAKAFFKGCSRLW